MKSYVAHLKNKYPSAVVLADDHQVQALSKDGDVLCSVVKDGGGRWVDGGGKYRFSLDPLPKDCRFMKHYSGPGQDHVGRSEEHDERKPNALKLESQYGFVPGPSELAALDAKKKKDAEEKAKFEAEVKSQMDAMKAKAEAEAKARLGADQG